MKFLKQLTIALATIAAVVGAPALVATSVSAATPQESACRGSGGTWNGTSCANANSSDTLPGFIRSVINLLLFVIGAVAVIMIILGGIRYVLSNGDQSSVTAAKNTILYAVIGLVVAILAYSIVNFVVTSL